ncbi:glomulin isoform X2 [Phyllostomus discolor]|uniref:Glomulin isoform X2 n=1 Tax=Phyllostomus discolor TaxID=89673 RepID=A0A7E6DT28_9CHIR|nr:glomulin isoform X2 [Phyllostomus discolor]
MAVEELQSIIKRCQILEEQDFKEEDFGLFQLAGQRCIDEGYIDQLLEIIQNEKNKVIIKSMGWNLVGPVVRCLLWNDKEDDKRKYFLMLDLLIKGFLSAIGYPFPKMIFNHGRKKRTWDYLEFEEEEEKQLADSLASLAYLVFVQGISIDQLPMVLSPSYLLRFNMGHIEVFLQRTEESVLSKGLDLLENGLLRIEDNSLLHQYLEIKSFLTVPQSLVKVMTLCPVETLRKKGLAMLQLYINKLDAQGKYTLFRCLLNTSNHSGVEAFVIQNIKNQIDISLKRTHNNKWFTGPQLISLLDLVLFLPEGAETDLLQNSDRIMASLNLLRYLVIKDNENDNQTGLWTELGKIENNYLKPLHTGLNMSKAHYEAEIKNSQENSQEFQNSKGFCSVTVGGEEIPNMPPEMQLKVLHSALYTFDLIESVLARVEELIEIKTKSTSGENTGIK